MKYIFIFILLTISFNSIAQKIHYTDPGNMWVTKGSMFEFGCEFTRIRTLGADTLINGHIYKPVLSTGNSQINAIQNCLGGPPYPAPPMYVRDDTVDNMVYCINYFVSADSNEQVLFDYNLNMYDTFVLFLSPAASTTFIVFDIDSTIINGVYHKIWACCLNSTYQAGSILSAYTVVEGVGDLSEYYPPFCGFEHYEKLNCFQQNSTYVPLTSPFIYEAYSSSPFRIPYSTDSLCPTVSVKNTQRNSIDFAISPNPANSQFSIDLCEPINCTATLTVLDVTCRTFYTEKLTRFTNAMIDCSNWPSGAYFISIESETGANIHRNITVCH